MQAGMKEGEQKAGTKVYGHRSLYFVPCSYGTRTSTRNSSRPRGSVRYSTTVRVQVLVRVPCAEPQITPIDRTSTSTVLYEHQLISHHRAIIILVPGTRSFLVFTLR